MSKCKDCGTFYRNMDHSVYDCAQAGGAEAKRIMAGATSMSDVAIYAEQQADETTPPAFVGTTDAF